MQSIKIHTPRFRNTELETDSESGVETDSGQTQQQKINDKV